jgi:hypothetical protein
VGDLEVDLEVLSGASAELARVRDELAGVHVTLDAGIEAAESDSVGHKLGSFGHGWVDGRRAITSEIDTLEQALAGVAETFEQVEDQLAADAPRPQSSAQAHPSGGVGH